MCMVEVYYYLCSTETPKPLDSPYRIVSETETRQKRTGNAFPADTEMETFGNASFRNWKHEFPIFGNVHVLWRHGCTVVCEGDWGTDAVEERRTVIEAGIGARSCDGGLAALGSRRRGGRWRQNTAMPSVWCGLSFWAGNRWLLGLERTGAGLLFHWIAGDGIRETRGSIWGRLVWAVVMLVVVNCRWACWIWSGFAVVMLIMVITLGWWLIAGARMHQRSI